ncbi:MFS transporter [Oceanospirillum sediminis]|uniref:MFS transporter n=1 Tax=Oceanospirillum sediminis TaxID=2760088 RepID=A0A839IU53_9GAMM|nr:MFS transporter [Oceanospirillum sediminis]MBB1488885.1 MFS transporter [Oceanospirillum sediminis]
MEIFMRLAIILGANQVISHGFGVFLFAALFPLMRDALDMTYWHLTLTGVATQIAYLAGALCVSILGRIISAERLILLTAGGATLLLAGLSQVAEPVIIIVLLFLLAFSAAGCWGAIVGLISQYADKQNAATSLSVAGSGTAWGYGINGLILLWWVPVFGWQSVWILTAGIAGLIFLTTLYMMRSLSSVSTRQPEKLSESELNMLSVRQLIMACLTEHRALFSCLIYFQIGLTCITFTSWLNTRLDEVDPSGFQGAITWSVIGISGMLAGILIGRVADKKGHEVALLLAASGYAAGLLAFSFNPLQFAVIAGAGYGMIYFPVWGVVSSWLAQRYSPVATMQLSGVGMIASAIGGSLGNIIAGQILNQTGSLTLLYDFLAFAGCVTVVLVGGICWHKSKGEVTARLNSLS